MKYLQDKNGVFNLSMVAATIAVSTIVLLLAFYNNNLVLNIDFRWYQPSAFVVIALMAQMFFKLNDIREQTKILESEFYRLQEAVIIRSNTLLRVIIFYFISLIVISILLSVFEPSLVQTIPVESFVPQNTALEKIHYIKIIKLLAISYVFAWMLSIINAYSVYRDISDYKSNLALRELLEDGRKNALKRLKGS